MHVIIEQKENMIAREHGGHVTSTCRYPVGHFVSMIAFFASSQPPPAKIFVYFLFLHTGNSLIVNGQMISEGGNHRDVSLQQIVDE